MSSNHLPADDQQVEPTRYHVVIYSYQLEYY
jgi:hypothetical protein